jgi:transcription factor E
LAIKKNRKKTSTKNRKLKAPGSRKKTPVKPRKKKPMPKEKESTPVLKAVNAKFPIGKKEIIPRKPTKEERKQLRRVLTILGDAYVRQMLIEVGGENALAIVRNFFGDHSDEELAKRLKLKISDVRATLNKLHNEGLVNYVRMKDSETGWYSYSWSLNHDRMKNWASSQNGTLVMLGSDGGDYYFCPSCGEATITNFVSAANGDFRCERCNRLLEFLDDKKMNELFEKRRLLT